jgi:hypothetical protein
MNPSIHQSHTLTIQSVHPSIHPSIIQSIRAKAHVSQAFFTVSPRSPSRLRCRRPSVVGQQPLVSYHLLPNISLKFLVSMNYLDFREEILKLILKIDRWNISTKRTWNYKVCPASGQRERAKATALHMWFIYGNEYHHENARADG